jgi:hypothetical protein
VEKDPTVGVALRPGSDYDIFADELLLRFDHGHHLHFTQLDGFVHRHHVDSVKVMVQLEAFRARAQLSERHPMTAYNNNKNN